MVTNANVRYNALLDEYTRASINCAASENLEELKASYVRVMEIGDSMFSELETMYDESSEELDAAMGQALLDQGRIMDEYPIPIFDDSDDLGDGKILSEYEAYFQRFGITQSDDAISDHIISWSDTHMLLYDFNSDTTQIIPRPDVLMNS